MGPQTEKRPGDNEIKKKEIKMTHQMNHGIATLKKDIIIEEKIVRKKGEVGNITAFLPEDNIYAVIFNWKVGPENWFTFHSKESFEEYFDYELIK